MRPFFERIFHIFLLILEINTQILIFNTIIHLKYVKVKINSKLYRILGGL